MAKLANVLAVLSVVAVNLTGCLAEPKCASSECASDAKITSTAKAQLNKYPELGPPNLISVQTRDRVVYLSGSVSAGVQSRTAEKVVARLPGVQRVVNTIWVTK